MGKGSKRRNEDTNKYRDAWEIIWGEPKKDKRNANKTKKKRKDIQQENR